jgi:fructose-1,6-bisphosphatase/inositol monophosphatase family enzyme
VSSGGAAGEQTLLAVAHEAARAGAEELTARFAAGHTGVRFKSTPTDPVSDADLAAEAAIRAVITRERPGDAIIGEEGGATGGGSELRWVVDPLDGTVNYLHGIPEFAVSIACEDADGGLAAVVLNPVSGETFAATRSGPATLDGSPISGADCSELSRALVATGFAYDAEVRGVQSRALARVLPPRRRGARPVRLRLGHLRRVLRARRQALGHRGRDAHLPARRARRADAGAGGDPPRGRARRQRRDRRRAGGARQRPARGVRSARRLSG